MEEEVLSREKAPHSWQSLSPCGQGHHRHCTVQAWTTGWEGTSGYWPPQALLKAGPQLQPAAHPGYPQGWPQGRPGTEPLRLTSMGTACPWAGSWVSLQCTTLHWSVILYCPGPCLVTWNRGQWLLKPQEATFPVLPLSNHLVYLL